MVIDIDIVKQNQIFDHTRRQIIDMAPDTYKVHLVLPERGYDDVDAGVAAVASIIDKLGSLFSLAEKE